MSEEKEAPETRTAFSEFLLSQGYDDDGMFDVEEMELAFDTGVQVAQAIAAQQPQPAPKRDTRAETLAQIAFAEYYGRQAGASLDMPDSWAMQSDAGRDDWRATARAVAAHVANPAAADYDNAAEITRLRDALEDIARAAQGSIDASLPADHDWFVSRAMEGLGCLPEGWPKAERPAPELAEAMAETRRVLDLFDQATKAVLTKRWALTDSEKRIISGFRRQAGLPV